MVLMNLPRSIRFRKETVILAGIIPALKHEPKSLNHFLNPAVDGLNALWESRLTHITVHPLQSRFTLQFYILLQIFQQQGNCVDSWVIVQGEAALTAILT